MVLLSLSSFHNQSLDLFRSFVPTAQLKLRSPSSGEEILEVVAHTFIQEAEAGGSL